MPGNPNIFDFLGDQKDFFMKSSWKVFCNMNGNRQYVGKTSNEKTFNPNMALTEWYDNTGGTQTLFVLDIQKFDFTLGFSFQQVLDPNVLAAAWNFVKDDSDPNFTYAYQGSEPVPLKEAEWRFVGQSRSGLQIILVIRRGILVANGEFKAGTPGEYSAIPVNVRALQDTTVTDKSRDMVYFMIGKEPLS